jgi:hypothetical protein
LVAERIYSRLINQTCPPYNNSILIIKFIKENSQTRVEINYRINSLSPWEKAFYFTEIKDLQTALESKVSIKRSTMKILWIGYLIDLAIGIVGIGGVAYLGFLQAGKVLPIITGYPQNHWVNGVTAFVITMMIYNIEFLYFYKLSAHPRLKNGDQNMTLNIDKASNNIMPLNKGYLNVGYTGLF